MNSLILSSALDTNGQNARYVRASEKWGTDEGVLKALAIGDYDPAAVVARYAAASEKFGELRIRSAHRSEHMYQSMPSDLIWTRDNQNEIRALADEADIIHLNNSYRPWQKLKFSRLKPMLLHHHGSLFRFQTKELLRWAANNKAVQAVSTVDLMRAAPERLHWLPTAYDVDGLVAFGAEHRDEHDGIRVVSAPTNRAFKSTDLLEAAIRKLQDDGLGVELQIIEGRPWAECMAIKASADIYFDQVILGYGCNAIEAWGMNIPVIAGGDPWTLAKMVEVYGTDKLPFYEATVDTIADAIADLATHKAKRTQYAKRGMTHIRSFHDEKPALTRLAALYRMAMIAQDYGAEPEPVPPVSFTAAIPQVRAAGRYITFPYTTDNPHIAASLRALALRRPRYRIEEVT